MLESQIQENIKYHREEVRFYAAIHWQFNLREQRRLRKEISKLSKEIDRKLPVLDFGSGTGNGKAQLYGEDYAS